LRGLNWEPNISDRETRRLGYKPARPGARIYGPLVPTLKIKPVGEKKKKSYPNYLTEKSAGKKVDVVDAVTMQSRGIKPPGGLRGRGEKKRDIPSVVGGRCGKPVGADPVKHNRREPSQAAGERGKRVQIQGMISHVISLRLTRRSHGEASNLYRQGHFQKCEKGQEWSRKSFLGGKERGAGGPLSGGNGGEKRKGPGPRK